MRNMETDVIPDKEQANILSLYWSMLMELEGQCSPNDQVNRSLVEAGFTVLNRCEYTEARPRWEKKNGNE